MTIDLKKLFPVEHTDNKFVGALLKAIKSGAKPEFDYLKFKQSISSLEEMDMAKGTAVKSAFTTASTMGLTKNKLLQSTKYYQKILNNEKAKFATAVQNQMDERISKKLSEAEKLKQRIEDYELKISKMNQEMEAYKQKINSVDSEITEAKNKIENTKNNFLVAYEKVSSILSEDIEMISNHL